MENLRSGGKETTKKILDDGRGIQCTGAGVARSMTGKG